MPEETDIQSMPSVPSDIYTPLDPTDNSDVEKVDTDDKTGTDGRPVKQPHLNAEVDPDSPQAYKSENDDADDPMQDTPGHHNADRGFEYDDENADKAAS